MPTVLIVNDNSVVRKVLQTVFNHTSGFDACLEARNSLDALEKTKRLSPNLVVLDLFMPGDMDGLQLARALKAIAPELPIFMLTADYDTYIEKEAFSSGVTAVFSKVDDLPTLVANAQAVCGIK